MHLLKGGVVLIITLILFLITSSIVAIREDPSLIGVDRQIPTGPDPLHNPPQPSPKHHHWIGVEENNIDRSWNYVDYESHHAHSPIHNSPEPAPLYRHLIGV
ncbi:unnamed protein product [Arabidopsis thaliana]|uniref:CLAVATA3/ESR (CLE)-related protein 18 n=3 Tax=Arabidopsis TaxID=3701 RepID=CLE18_ARATH|nr:CLAVATA3/ESR-RELATED 18 [Arabidopsis thaliana]Q3ECH9.1 RecName: Full=CLAVATA3/ESR (CLE)-related protein 18; Contains: RecName: Full=CLE18p; Contains: RecName: Full=CLE18 C-terminus; Flags: Precursor [Arabidopsis thaliana]AEE34467.1 CLAVATA3/ESR-RELATED 18 [Arabidopsis thaliana]CAD5316423.1 unnamed protein product [Arabidopsis thaliana]|eukprot:NP_683472.1 CLAVATA3/ESR-RELATED 18 [Arabidopsis thaliana]